MNVVRSLERRIERLLEGVAGRVFSGRLHPSEIAGKLAREADFARFDHDTGPGTANSYTILINPRDLTLEPDDLERTLTAEIDRYTAEEGLRLEGPVSVAIQASKEVPGGKVICHVEIDPGPEVAWARLRASETFHQVGRNRVLIGRSPTADIVLPYDDVSRRHALLWREGEQTWIRDLGSANGTTVDGNPVSEEGVVVRPGSAVGFSNHRYRFTEL